MHLRRMLVALLLATLPSAVPAVRAQIPSGAPLTLDVAGTVQQPLHLTVQDIESVPAEHVNASFVTEHGEQRGDYTGVSLWALLERAKLADVPGRRGHLWQSVTVTGRDGYAVMISIGELDPNFEGKAVIIAYKRDDQPLPAAEGLRLVVPGDKHAGRSVRDVVRIEVK